MAAPSQRPTRRPTSLSFGLASFSTQPVGEEPQDLVVRRRREVVVPLPDGAELVRLERADEDVGRRRHAPAGVGRADRNCGDHQCGFGRSHCIQRHLHGRAGRQAIVDDDDGSSGQRHGRSVPTQPHLPVLQLGARPRGQCVDVATTQSEPGHEVVVEDGQPAGRHCTDGQLTLPWGTDLAHGQHIELRAEAGSNGRGDRHPATGQAEHDHGERCLPEVRGDEVDQRRSGLVAVPVRTPAHGSIEARSPEPERQLARRFE